MNLYELSNEVNHTEKQKEVTNADMLASLVLIQSHLQKIEKIINENQKNDKKAFEIINKTLEHYDKNISAIPVLTSNITCEKINNIVADMNNGNANIIASTKALKESNAAFVIFLKCWIVSMVVAFVLVLFLVCWR